MTLLFSLAFAERPELQVDELIDLIVLDVNGTHGAFKVVHTLGEYEGLGEPRNCGYAGMKAHPTAGVDLVVVELASGQQKRFTVYASVRDDGEAGPGEACTPHETSTKVLAEAKAMMKAVGLDPGAKPKPAEGGKVGGATFTSNVTAVPDDETMSSNATWTIERDGQAVYTSDLNYSMIMAGDAKPKFHGVWPVKGGAVALHHWWMFSGRGGSSNAITFTPVLPLK